MTENNKITPAGTDGRYNRVWEVCIPGIPIPELPPGYEALLLSAWQKTLKKQDVSSDEKAAIEYVSRKVAGK